MQTALFALVSAFLAAALAYFLTQRKCQQVTDGIRKELEEAKSTTASGQAENKVRLEELRASIDDVREREREAKERAREAEIRLAKVGDELKLALEQKGVFQNEATRVSEMRTAVQEREAEIANLNERINRLERENAEAIRGAQAANDRADSLIAADREAHSKIVKAKDEQIEALNSFIAQAGEALSNEFKALSADAIKDASAQLTKAAEGIIGRHADQTAQGVKIHKQQIETMLKPVEETIKRLDKHVEDSNLARSNAEAVLNDQVNRLAGASESLTNALRKPVVRGSWGEMTLENALENAGLEAEIDFVLQHYTDEEDGKKRTDAIVNLPKGRKLIIDSKNLMESYVALTSATDEAQRAICAEVHSKSLSRHIKALSGKEYWRRYDGLDCVILFIPHDGMYHSAIRDETELIRDASEKRVFVANPMSLIPLLKAIRYVLDQDRLNKSAEEISKVGTDLYTEVARFAESMAKIGNRLKSTVSAYNDAIPGLDRFIVAKSRSLKQLGAAKGAEPELPESIDIEPKLFNSRELQASNAVLVDH